MDGSIVFTGGANVHQFNTCFRRPTGVSIPNGILIGTAFFAQLMAEVRTLQLAANFTPQNCPSAWGSGPQPWAHPSIHPKRHQINRFSHFCRAHNYDRQTNQQIDWQRDQQTDHATQFVTIGCSYVVLRCSLIIVKNSGQFFYTQYFLKANNTTKKTNT